MPSTLYIPLRVCQLNYPSWIFFFVSGGPLGSPFSVQNPFLLAKLCWAEHLFCILSDSLYWMVQRFFLLTIIWTYLSSLYTLTPSLFLEALCEQVYQNGCETWLHLWSLGVLEIAWDPWKSTCNKVRAPSGMKHRKLKHTCSFIVEIH